MKQNINYDEIYHKTRPIIVQAGKMAKRYFRLQPVVEYKNVTVNNQPERSIFTRADREIELYIRRKLEKAFPDFGFVGEESTRSNIKAYNWVLDPIDGTQNFIRGIPIFCQSLALWYEDKPIYGIVYLPFLDQTIHATYNHGLWVGDKHIKKVGDAIGGPYILYGMSGSDKEKRLVVEAVSKIIIRFGSFYSAVYHGVLCATGKTDVVIYYKLGLWDIATGVIFAKEAGLDCEYITPKPNLQKKNLKDYQHTLVIGNKKWVPKIADAIRKLKIK